MTGVDDADVSIQLQGPFGLTYVCGMGFSLRVDRRGRGWIYHQVLTDSRREPTACVIRLCTDAAGTPLAWRFELVSPSSAEWSLCATAPLVGAVRCRLATQAFAQMSHSMGELGKSGADRSSCSGGSTVVLGRWLLSFVPLGAEVE